MKKIGFVSMFLLVSNLSFGYGTTIKTIDSHRLNCQLMSTKDHDVHQITMTRTLKEKSHRGVPQGRTIEFVLEEANDSNSIAQTLLQIYNQAQGLEAPAAKLSDSIQHITQSSEDLGLQTELGDFGSEFIEFPEGAGVFVNYKNGNFSYDDKIPLGVSGSIEKLQSRQFGMQLHIHYKILNREQPLKSFAGLMDLTGFCTSDVE